MTVVRDPAIDGTVVSTARAARRRRDRVIVAVLAVIVVALSLTALSLGASAVGLVDLLASLVGRGDPRTDLVVFQLRLPRVVMAILVGAAFALSGALFQSLLGNPLASPDIIGITGGASAAAVAAILLFGLGGFAVPLAALGGALVVAAAIAVLSWTSGLTGYRFVLIGIASAFFVEAIVGYLLTRADVRDAQSALLWLVGSLNGARWEQIATTAMGLAVLLPLVAIVASRLRVLQLGDDSATSLGARVQPARIAVLAVAVGLAALGTAAVGPLAFVAFVAAPIARRLSGTGGLALVPSALVGIVIVLASDLVAQHALPEGVRVPAGIITGAVGAPYLLWLLARTNRRHGDLE